MAATPEHPNFAKTTTTIYGIQGDTLIDSKTWLKIYSTTDSLFQQDLVLEGFLRVINQQVLYLDTTSQLDTLYDFSKAVGDSVLFHINGTTPEWLKVKNVDYVQLNANAYKSIRFSEPSLSAFDHLNEVWIEGIGSIHGPLFPHHPVKFSEEAPDSMLLVCTYSNGSHIWENTNYTSCNVNITLNVAKQHTSHFNVYPNPFNDKLFVQQKGVDELTLFNSMGAVIQQFTTTPPLTSIDLSFLKAGVYFLRIRTEKNALTIKIIKQP